MASSPYINHFIQPDTIIPNPADPQSWNRYSYVQNNPIRFSDPTGHITCSNSNNYCVPATQELPDVDAYRFLKSYGLPVSVADFVNPDKLLNFTVKVVDNSLVESWELKPKDQQLINLLFLERDGLRTPTSVVTGSGSEFARDEIIDYAAEQAGKSALPLKLWLTFVDINKEIDEGVIDDFQLAIAKAMVLSPDQTISLSMITSGQETNMFIQLPDGTNINAGRGMATQLAPIYSVLQIVMFGDDYEAND